jgi:hypothetical protein
MKISHYCSALESLFSTDSIELSHKLSERIAIFLREFNYDPLTVFNDIKSFYSIRSKVTHGDSIAEKKGKLIQDISITCDKYLRNIINIIIDSPDLIQIFDGSKSDLEDYFKKKLFYKHHD